MQTTLGTSSASTEMPSLPAAACAAGIDGPVDATGPKADPAVCRGPVVVSVGERDRQSRPAHTLALRKALDEAELTPLPGAGHGRSDIRRVIDVLTAPRERGR
jgi:pimeloyl-ACP methyl ester carboxylesterase